MLYALVRAIAGVALRWFYRDIEVHGTRRIPRRQPLLFVVNHPNALVDALIVMWIAPRRVLITAKATLFQNPLAARLLLWFGVLPLRRATDERLRGGEADAARNTETFQAVNDALSRRRAILIFPEGKTHDDPFLAPLKTGAARMALDARDAGAGELAVVPIGLTFERKDAPRTRVLVQVGEPIAMAEWHPPSGLRPVEGLTAEIETRLRALTLNYANADDASRGAVLTSVIAAVLSAAAPLGRADRPLSVDAGIARRVGALEVELAAATPALRKRVDDLARRLDAFRRRTAAHGILIEDVGISTGRRDGARFLLREGWILALAGPVALWGKLNHWLPFHAAGIIAMRNVESAADPAMRTIVAGTTLVLLAYLAQGTAVGVWFGIVPAVLYLVSLPLAAEVNFFSSERLARAICRARAYIAFRRDPALDDALAAELTALRHEILALDAALGPARV